VRVSIGTTHLAFAVVVNLAIAAAIGMYLRFSWFAYSGFSFSISIFSFIIFCLLSLYFWCLVLRHMLYPLKSLVDTLHDALHPLSGENPQQRAEIEKAPCSLMFLQDKAWQIEQVAKELREQKEYLQTILEAIPDAIVTVNDKGLIQMVNSAAEKAFGFVRQELIGQKVDILVTSANEKYWLDIERCLQKRNGPFLREMREMEAKRKDGSTFPTELWLSSLRCNGQPVCLEVIRDITHRKKDEAAHAHYLHELESSNRELDDFAYIVSHDLKAPLRGLQTFSSILLEDYKSKLDAEGQKKLNTICDLTKNMETLLDTLLYYSRVGKTALAIHETDLNEIVQKVAESFAIMLKEKNAKIDVVQKLPLTTCDHVRIAEVFHNLIGNAIKYNNSKENKIEIGMTQNHPRKPGENVFYIRDNGIGIPEKHLDTIFKIFRRLHPKNAYGGGTGSGLAIVKKIIVQHGGDIWAESKGENQGTTFYFTIPQQKKE
jgi:PAS domain S-box-containing protein